MPSSPWPPTAGAPPPPPRAAGDTASTVVLERRPVAVRLPSLSASCSEALDSIQLALSLPDIITLGFPISARAEGRVRRRRRRGLLGAGEHGSASVGGLLLVRPSRLPLLSRALCLCNCRQEFCCYIGVLLRFDCVLGL